MLKVKVLHPHNKRFPGDVILISEEEYTELEHPEIQYFEILSGTKPPSKYAQTKELMVNEKQTMAREFKFESVLIQDEPKETLVETTESDMSVIVQDESQDLSIVSSDDAIDIQSASPIHLGEVPATRGRRRK